MFSSAFIALKLCCVQGLAQIPVVNEVLTPEEVSVAFSSPKFLVALLAGVFMAFAFQLLLTNFSVAVGISSSGTDSYNDESESSGSTIRKVETAVGLWAIATATIALFSACFLAVKLSLIESAFLGAIIGVVIWSAYFSLIMWLGSKAVGSLIGSVISTVTSGLQGIMGTATAALGANAAKNQIVSTAEEISAVVRRELVSGLDPDPIRNTLQNSLTSIQSPKLDVKEIRSQFDKLLKDTDLRSIADSDLLKNINRQTFVDLISSRTDFSKEDVNRIAEQLQNAWNQILDRQNPTEQVIRLIQQATPEDLQSDRLGEKVQQLATVGGGNSKQSNGIVKQALEIGLGVTLPTVLKQVDLSQLDVERVSQQLQQIREKVQDVDVEKITQQLQQIKDQATHQAEKFGGAVAERLPVSVNNTIKADVEEYILNSFPWHFNRITIQDEFKEVIYDRDANPSSVRQQLEDLNEEYLTNLLQQRSDLSEARIKEISELLQSTKNEVLETVKQAEAREQKQNLRTRLEDYLRSTNKEELNPEGIEQNLTKLLEDPEGGFEDLREQFSQIDRDTLVGLLAARSDLNEEEANNIVSQFEQTRDNLLNRARELQEQARAKADELRQRVEDYLRNTNKEELNPEGIKRDLKTLLEDPEAGISAFRARLSQFDRDTLVKLLSQRQDLSEEQINRTVDSIQQAIENIVKAPRRFTNRTTQRIVEFEANLENYLRNTNKEELNPEAIKRDLQLLLSSPRAGVSSLGERVSKFDRSTLVSLLSQREDISPEEANRIVDRIESVRDSIVEQYQQVQKRVQSIIDTVFERVRNYLNSLDRPELNYESIQQDFAKLFDSPQAGFEALRDRLSQFDRDTLVALIGSREDISEEQANQIVNRIEAARDSVLKQAERIQQETQKRLDAIKEQTKKQAVETKKVVAGAAWWLFNTASISLAASALAGALAVSGFNLFG
ncbi:MFS transporter [Scytonema sp. NUACC26]|uniref:MFS transporter n=1 Tax=Scytonema sp. NUACC26 TaxID=3140176 RepID=UPI0034DBF5A7